MKFARRPKTELDINLTPLIDVVFLLLIFFMVSTTFIRDSHLSIDLPKASAEASKIAADIIEITISKSGAYAVNGTGLVNNSAKVLKKAVEATSEGSTDLPLVITADSATPHQAVITAMDVAGQLGFVHLSITTKHNGSDDNE